jgi:cytochrome c oxidase subunit 2
LAEPDRPDIVDRSERLWAYVVGAVVAFVFAVIVFTGLHWAAQPPSNVETIDATRLHL